VLFKDYLEGTILLAELSGNDYLECIIGQVHKRNNSNDYLNFNDPVDRQIESSEFPFSFLANQFFIN
jgi:hypothetical protein